MKISTDTIIRTVVLVVALINQVLTATGKNPLPFSDDVIYEAVTLAVTIGASVWAWWKDTPITKAAQVGSAITAEIKSGGISIEDAESLLGDQQ